MPEIRFKTHGTCSRFINVEVEDGKVKDVRFEGGCAGNTLGVAKLVIGMDANEAVQKLSGIKCGFKDTSCPDQLSKAIKTLLEDEKN